MAVVEIPSRAFRIVDSFDLLGRDGRPSGKSEKVFGNIVVAWQPGVLSVVGDFGDVVLHQPAAFASCESAARWIAQANPGCIDISYVLSKADRGGQGHYKFDIDTAADIVEDMVVEECLGFLEDGDFEFAFSGNTLFEDVLEHAFGEDLRRAGSPQNADLRLGCIALRIAEVLSSEPHHAKRLKDARASILDGYDPDAAGDIRDFLARLEKDDAFTREGVLSRIVSRVTDLVEDEADEAKPHAFYRWVYETTGEVTESRPLRIKASTLVALSALRAWGLDQVAKLAPKEVEPSDTAEISAAASPSP